MSEAIVDVSVSYSDDSGNGKEFVYGKCIGEIVRCKDCKFQGDDLNCPYCNLCGKRKFPNDDWYCADGERKKE